MSSFVMVGGGLLLLTGSVLAFVALGGLASDRRGVASSLAAIQVLGAAPEPVAMDPDPSFVRRVLAPYAVRFAGLARRLTRSGAEARIQRRLDIAGNPTGWDVDRMLGVKVVAMGVLGGAALLYGLAVGVAPAPALAVAVVLALTGFLVPDLLLYNAGQKREALMRRALPDALDLMTISVEAGLGFDAAVLKVARNTTGPLAQEFSRLLQEMQLGMGRMAAMRAMGDRSTIKELRSFCQAMVQADQLGVPIGRVLRIQSKEMRVRRRQTAEEKAQKVPVKIMVPLVLCILPSLFLVVLGPAALKMMEAFG
ncbi:type II secretion system F family protein [Nocardioides sp. LMS-CY]|uniref:type II secretion system F family protein n=1 Tax=Nocardioides sp. (strain LMS-CY) TaxID=2840457 RepID=UPI001C004F23|nr:type II secretion system F family protein [Nocardioides sp. LMS-CY]QWF24271.1 type II secretion system F family protein [Nocardioides sp. LMS-CY]